MKASRLHLSALLFLTFAAFGSIGSFLNLFYLDQGMSVEQMGLLAAIPAGMSLLAAPFWAGIADRFHLHKYILPIVMLISLPLALNFHLYGTFGKLMVGIILFSGCFSSFLPLADHSVLVNLGKEKSNYGSIRLWGSIGIGIMAIITGWLVERSSLKVIFPLYAIFIIFAAISALALPRPPKIKIESYWKKAGQFLKDPRWRKFLIACLLSGFSHLFLGNYIFVFISDIGGKESFIGFAFFLAAVTNVITYHIMARLLKQWSAPRIILYSNILMVVRMLIAMMVRSQEMSIIVQLLDGPTWATMWSAGVHYASDIAPRGLGASAQALYNGIFTGLGGIISAILGGFIYARWGASILFLIGAATALISVIFLIPMNRDHILVSDKSIEAPIT